MLLSKASLAASNTRLVYHHRFATLARPAVAERRWVLAAARSFGNPPVKTPAAPAEIAPKKVLRLIAAIICCPYQLSTLTCSPRDEPAVVGRAVAFLTRRSFSGGGSEGGHFLILNSSFLL